MKCFTKQLGATALLAWTVVVASLSPAAVLAQNAPPARINTNSIQTTDGRPLFLRGFGRDGAQPAAYEGGFFHFRQAQREQYETGPMQEDLGGGTDYSTNDSLMPPMPDGAMPEEIVGHPEGPEPVISDDGHCPYDGGYGPVDDGYYCKDCEGGKGEKLGGIFDDWNWVCLCAPLPPDDNLTVNAGVHGFKGPLNLGLDSSFGYQAGANLGAAMPWCTLGIGWQVGVQCVESNLSGQGLLSSEERHQTFFTAGLFRRVDCGLQGGVVFDQLRDEWFYDFDLSQIRAELSWVCGGCVEFGFFGHFSQSDDETDAELELGDVEIDDISAEATDLYAVFYRHHFGDCGQTYGRVYVGITGERGSLFVDELDEEGATAVVGVDMHICLSECWALETGFTYLPATDDSDIEFDDLEVEDVGTFQESWNVGINLIWYPHRHTFGECRSYYRPLFNVADNGSFLTHITAADIDVDD